MEKLDIELDIIKCTIHKEDLQENFKEKLEEKLNSACETKSYTTIENNKNKISKPFYFHKAVAAVFVCIFMFSSCAFADGVGDWIKELFSNVDKGIEVAYENGDIKEVDTEYQTFDGVSVKVDYVSLKDNELYVVFNVKTEEEYDRVYFNDLLIQDEFDNMIFDNLKRNNENKYEHSIREKMNSSTNSLIICSVVNNKEQFQELKKMNIRIGNIQIKRNDTIENNYGDWLFEIDL